MTSRLLKSDDPMIGGPAFWCGARDIPEAASFRLPQCVPEVFTVLACQWAGFRTELKSDHSDG